MKSHAIVRKYKQDIGIDSIQSITRVDTLEIETCNDADYMCMNDSQSKLNTLKA